jgi:hypothetical protein
MNKITHPDPEELMAYLDGELKADRSKAAADHIGHCAECQELVSELRGISQTLQNWKVEPAEVPMTAIEIALAENRTASRTIPPVHRSRWNWFLRRNQTSFAWAGGALAILLVTFSTVPLHRRVSISSVGDLVADKKRTQLSEPSSLALSMPVEPPPAPPPAPASSSPSSENYSTLASAGRLRAQQNQMAASLENPSSDQPPASQAQVASGPMIIRTAELSLITNAFDNARTNLEAILKRHHGYVGDLKVGGVTGSERTLTATLRIPADQLDGALLEIKKLGRVESESQSGQDVTSQYVDLEARLGNSRNTEKRLTDLLRDRTGKLSDVLEVEQELARVRGEIEQMEAERKTMSNQISYATLNATITEDYKAQLQAFPPSTFTRLSNAAVEGYRSMVDGIMALALFLLSTGPSILLWGAILFFPARLGWKKLRSRFAS